MARAVEERRHRGRHRARQGHLPGLRRPASTPQQPDERERDAVLHGRRRRERAGAVEERRHRRRHHPGQGHLPGTSRYYDYWGVPGCRTALPRQPDERQRDAVLHGQRRHERVGAVEERRHRRRHRAGQGHQPRRRRLGPPLPDERQRHAVLLGQRRHARARAVEERRHRRRHRARSRTSTPAAAARTPAT